MIERGGHFTWEEDAVFDGIRQDASESIRRYRVLKNGHLFNRGAVTKDKGSKHIAAARIGTDSLDTLAAFDAHFNDGSQKLCVIQEGGSNADLYYFNTTDSTWVAQSQSIANNTRVVLLMFANKLHVIDGGTLRTWTGSSWATPGESTYSNPCTLGAVYANRLILSGHPTYPFTFFPSGIRDSGSWDAALSVDVTGAHGEVITSIGTMGSFLIVGGRTFTRSFYLGTASPYDWDNDHISTLIGPSCQSSFVSIPAVQGQTGRNVAFFWSTDGPMMLYQEGNGLPTLLDLSGPLAKAARGIEYQGLAAFAIDRYDDVVGVYVPEFDEIRFAVTKKTTFSSLGANSQNDMLCCLNLTSALAFAMGKVEYPYWRIRDNENKTGSVPGLPVSTIFSARIHPDTNAPSSAGVLRCLCAKNGWVYEMDAVSQDVDSIEGTDYDIPFYIRRDGYDGMEDGIRQHEKSLRAAYFRATLVGKSKLYARAIADGGARLSEAEIDLDGNLQEWNTDGGSGSWGDGNRWNAGEFVNKRGLMGTLGRKFDLEIYDNGNIKGDFQVNSWSLLGYAEDRR